MSQGQASNLLFKYFIKKIVEWYKEVKNINEDIPVPNTLTKTAIIKLHFFICTLDEELFKKHQFYAMQFGPVCGDLLNAMNQNSLGEYIIDMDGLQIDLERESLQQQSMTDNIANEDSIQEYKERYDQAINKLKVFNKKLVVTNAFNLTQISHSWFCWRRAWDEAELEGWGATEMNYEDVKREPIKNYA